jgi:GT2 family glycosyltransferase
MHASTEVPGVVIVILNWQNAPDTLECLESVSALDYPNAHILVVDNGSRDGSADTIAQSYPQIEMLRLADNLGYAEGNNQGIRRALAYHPKYILVLNNDTLLAPDMLTRLVEEAEAHPRAAMLGPTMFCTNPSDTLFATGSFVDWQGGEVRHRHMYQPESAAAALTDPNPVDFIIGCGVLIRARFLHEHGLLDPIYYLNFEDVEWGIRANQAGYQVLHVPSARLWHKVSATLGQASPANTYYLTRNALFFFWRATSGAHRLRVIARILARTIRTVGAWSLLPRYQTPVFRQKRNSNLFALRDFFLNRPGAGGSDVGRTWRQTR